MFWGQPHEEHHSESFAKIQRESVDVAALIVGCAGRMKAAKTWVVRNTTNEDWNKHGQEDRDE